MYKSQITRAHKGAIVLLLDQSGSMAEEIAFGGRVMTKAEALCEAVNELLEELVGRCKREHFVGDYFDVGIIGYSGDEARHLLGGGFMSIVKIDSLDTQTKSHLITRTLPSGQQFQTLIDRRVWITPQAKGRTPMGAALRLAHRMCQSWCNNHPESFPPVVINISDGEATDASSDEIISLAENIKALGTSDGSTVLLNIHLATEQDSAPLHLSFPSEGYTLPDNRHLRLLHTISSTLPELYNEAIAQLNGATPPFRGICFNSPITELTGLLAIGTISVDMII